MFTDWSLGVEEQFYILFSRFGFQDLGDKQKWCRNPFLAVGALTIASLIGFLLSLSNKSTSSIFPDAIQVLGDGSRMLDLIGFQRASVEQLLEKVPPLLVMALIVGVMYLPMSLAAASTIQWLLCHPS